ncbi:succinylglutamate-semialdehyde dehydrogenase [Mariniblastus fucicola]|uniref:N-succinylglutamate 5-semialdehyde dehydrogenase n=1 Tax=Mariniblastus fucicola TaxID=980251 RepID=A0A5B9P7K4_9BACT|nr:succinylglutamate-semialdehyde dehydrogenase [Mariniblastus fucicola]QEG21185.1 N-succinylglutamate 5-semialdehyde dehydrogenase [Mariniblastus fucicola]
MLTSKTELRIGDQWISGSGSPIQSVSPIDESVVFETNEATADQVNAAFSAARDAFGSWWDQPLENRIAIVQKYAELVRESGDELAEIISAETGKILWEAKTEAGAVAGKVDVSIDALKTRRDTTSFEMGEVKAVTRFKPHGVVGVLGPFNFPAHLPNGHIVPALLAGNTIVFKPSEQTPAVGAWMMQKWIEAGLPNGVLNLVQGGRDVGQAICASKEIDGLFFTGSSGAGAALNKALAAEPGKILALEMGGNNPLIVTETSDMDTASYLTILSAFITAGQRCTCARRLILIDNDESKQFLNTLVEMTKKVTFGFSSDDPQPFIGTVISGAMGRHILETQEKLIARGGDPIVKMESHRGCDALISPGIIDVTEVSDREDEELFGPLLSVIRVPDFEAAITEANNTAYGLSAGILTDNADLYRQFIHQIRAGIVNWNRQTTGASGKLPFGGCGRSGNNRPSAYYAADYCSFPVASLESESLAMPEQLMQGLASLKG